ncbi:hypothetical protein PZA11_007870 [Diplocarpon coronariae]|uniref:Uncharacterized protein n=1 Tax=Diplocarpon coronariae TaxID=2795749 RepID=A0A218ZEG6_9HELO|nr:hypothetical protein JHW43_005412 [Diplocarpon mali]OWP05923.1 hypothetical protein B2J93_6247 [Marssonina coronariae]
MSAPAVVDSADGVQQPTMESGAEQSMIAPGEEDGVSSEGPRRLEPLPEDPEKEDLALGKRRDPEKEELAAEAERSAAGKAKEAEVQRASDQSSNGDQIVTDTTAPSEYMSTAGEMESTLDGTEDLKAAPVPPSRPPLEKLAQKNPKPMDHFGITLGPPLIILFDIVVPIIIYYAWYNTQIRLWGDQCRAQTPAGQKCTITKPEYNEEILGYAIISFGFGEVYILIVRVWRLVKHRDICAPLLSRSKWELDATSWVYGVSMICALIPFVVGSTLEIPELYLYSPGFLMGFLGWVMLVTMIPFKLPIGINSHARGTKMRPFIYYAAEDFIAVDGLQDREFRVRYNARYDSSKAFRQMFLYLTYWWIFGVLVYLGCLSAVIWKISFHYAFGLTLGILFAYIFIWAITSYYYVMWSMHREKVAWENPPSVA